MHMVAADGDMRLVSRVDVNGYATGALQVQQSGFFGSVCSTNFGSADADVACRQLGFVSGTDVPRAVVDDLSDNLLFQVPFLYK